jgi:hypothetical protein
MTDLDLLVAGAMVSFLAFAGAYVAIRHRANESPAGDSRSQELQSRPASSQHEKADVR